MLTRDTHACADDLPRCGGAGCGDAYCGYGEHRRRDQRGTGRGVEPPAAGQEPRRDERREHAEQAEEASQPYPIAHGVTITPVSCVVLAAAQFR